MTLFRFLALAAAVLPFWGSVAAAQSRAEAFPRITQARDAKACGPALVVAKRAFSSTAAKIADAAPLILADKKPDFGILLAPDAHTPDGDEMIVDEAAVQQENGGRFKALFLQKATQGSRFVVSQQKMNWQGDFFGLYLADATRDADETAELLANEKKPDAKTIFKDSWQRPWLIRDPATGAVVAIDTQHPAEVLADWIVYRNANGAPEAACHIAFRPPVKRTSDLLPTAQLRALAALLDDILGTPAKDEGTLQPTARLRVAAAQAWGNVALRPWAIEEPDSSEKEITDGLEQWAKRSPAHRGRHRRLQALLPQAERDLAAYYQKTLGKSAPEAAAVAKQALARAVGVHFVFAKTGE
jgi:hypothetical protein